MSLDNDNISLGLSSLRSMLEVPEGCQPAPQAEPIPTYRIDLSLPPAERYIELATDFASRLGEVDQIFKEAIKDFVPWPSFHRLIVPLTRLVCRRVYDAEEMEELRCISRISGVGIHLLVLLNVLLDSLMGCTSGGVLTTDEDQFDSDSQDPALSKSKITHFRTLDWEMDGLRNLLVVLEFVRSNSKDPKQIVATSITYAGFVGVLTGTRKNLSISLNNRPVHHCSSLHLHIHKFLVTIGRRPSISSILRSALIPDPTTTAISLAKLCSKLSNTQTAPCYLILSDGNTTTCLQKDLLTATSTSSVKFVVQTNHDSGFPIPYCRHRSGREFFKGSKVRRNAIRDKWKALQKPLNGKDHQHRNKKCGENDHAAEVVAVPAGVTCVPEDMLENWLRAYPTMNAQTHFVCTLDPSSGTVRMLQRGLWVRDESEDDDNRVSVDMDDVLAEEDAMILQTVDDKILKEKETSSLSEISKLIVDDRVELAIGLPTAIDRGTDTHKVMSLDSA